MTAITRFLDPLRHAATAFFRHDVALQRADDGLRIVLHERGTQRRPSRAELAARKDEQELALMRTQLAALLDELPDTRHTMRHLVFVEQALARKGLRALHKLPLNVLQRALEQLEGLVTNWSPLGLAGLRSKMAVAIIDREHMDPDAEAETYRTAAVLDATPPPVAAAVEDAASDDDALAAAYAAYAAVGNAAAALPAVQLQAELGSPSARAMALPPRAGAASTADLRLREPQA